MRDPRCWREIYIRGGITLIISAVAYFALDADLWIWLFPVVIVALVLAKWSVRPAELDDPDGDDPPAGQDAAKSE